MSAAAASPAAGVSVWHTLTQYSADSVEFCPPALCGLTPAAAGASSQTDSKSKPSASAASDAKSTPAISAAPASAEECSPASALFVVGNYQLLDPLPASASASAAASATSTTEEQPTTKVPQKKVGAIYLFELLPYTASVASVITGPTPTPAAGTTTPAASVTPAFGVMQRDCVQTQAILDLKWCPQPLGSRLVLGAACTKATLACYQLSACNLVLVFS